MEMVRPAAFQHRARNKDLLRFMTCGSVDDGKSTLIGRLLHDTRLIFDDQFAALVETRSPRHNGWDIDFALLLDGLEAEREQGITSTSLTAFLRRRGGLLSSPMLRVTSSSREIW